MHNNKTVLLIDDEPGIASALVVRLSAEGYVVETAMDGRSGLAAAAETQPDVILLDIRMPDIDGIEVCRRLKTNPELAATPVIFLSANVKDVVRHQALEAGGSAFLSKPYEPRDVLNAIRSAVTPANTTEAQGSN